MLISSVEGNLHDGALADDTDVETVTLPSAQLVKRIQRVLTDRDREVGIRLAPDAPDLRDGDILHVSDGQAIVVRVASTDVIAVGARSILEMAVVAHALGNRHLQAQFFDADSEFGAEVMVVPYDHTVAQYLDSVGVPYERREVVLPQPFRHSEHTH